MTDKGVVLGWLERVWFPEFGTPDEGVVAKIDTGADSGALHCTGERLVHGEDGQIILEFQPFDDKHNVIRTKNYELTKVRNVHGVRERYRIKTTIHLQDGKDYPIELTLVDRKHMKYEVIIGRRFLYDKFVVDVSQENI